MSFQSYLRAYAKKYAVILGLVLPVFSTVVAAPSCYAQSTTAGTISNIIVLPGGAVVFNQSGQRYNIPSCGAGEPTRWAFNVNSNEGQARFASLLSAYAMGKSITISGSGACPDWGDTESVTWIQVDG